MTTRSQRKAPCNTCPCPAWGLECAEHREAEQPTEQVPVVKAPPETPLPARGDAVEAWLRAHRDRYVDSYGRTRAWYLFDDLLDQYRLHADTATPLGEHVCEGRVIGDCDCMEVRP